MGIAAMKSSCWMAVCFGCALAVSAAHADVKLHNKDTKAHDITAKCGSSTVNRSVQAGTVATLGKGPCEITVKGSGIKMSGSGDSTLVIDKPKK